MATYAHIQDRIYFGYGKAASKVGQEYTIYRSSNAINPTNPLNDVGKAFFSSNVSWDYMKANKYGNAVFQLLVDGRIVRPFDYLIGAGAPNTPDETYYISAFEPILPINGVQCNRTVTITRPVTSMSAGVNPYGGYEPSDVDVLATGMPCSILETSRAYNNQFKLPTDTKSPSYHVLIPSLTNLELRIGDLVDDDRGVRLGLSTVELTELGFRCIAVSEQT